MNLFGFDVSPDRMVIGLFTGLTYGLLAVGLVLVYRSSRFVNFAHGSVGVFGAATLGTLVTSVGVPYWVAFPLALLVAGALSAAIEALVVRRVSNRPRIVGMIVTLGLSQFILVLALLVNRQGLSGLTFPKPPGMPSFHLGRTPVGPAFTAMLLLTPVLLVLLGTFLRRSRHGLAIRAAADSNDTARLSGVAAARMPALAWAIAGAVAAFSAILVTPTQGTQSIDTLGPELLLRGLAGAVIGRLSSLPIAFGASLGIGVLEQVLLSRGSGTGLVELVLGTVILIALLRQPKLGRRETESFDSMPVGAGRMSLPWTAVGFTVAIGLAYVVDNRTASVLTSVVGFALVGLSVLLVTGIAGELSLGQFAFAGIAAAVSVRVGMLSGNFLVAAVAGCLAAAAAAVVVGIPALRLRGLALAVTTLAFALATSAWLLRQDFLLGSGVAAPKPAWGDYTLDLAKDYYLFALLVLAIGLILTQHLRRSDFGRLLVALRDNEDAARALSVSAPLRKLSAYALAGVLAGLGGVVIGHGQSTLTVNSFPSSAGVDVVALTVVGGLGSLVGPLLGSALTVGLPGLVELGILGQAGLTLVWLAVVLLLPGGLSTLLSRRVLRFGRAGSPPTDARGLGRVPRRRPVVAGLTGRVPGKRPVVAGLTGRSPGKVAAGQGSDESGLGRAGADMAATAGWHASPPGVEAWPPGVEVSPSGVEVSAGAGWRGAELAELESKREGWAGLRPLRTDGAQLVVRGVAKSFGGVQAVAGVDLTVQPGEVVGILGPNGAGKTTFFEIVAGFTRPDAGTVHFGGRDITQAAPERRARLGLVRSFQDARGFPTLTVRENVIVAQERRLPSRVLSAALGARAADRTRARRADELIELMELGGVAGQRVGELSTGTRRLVELTCLLALEPQLLLLDEPSSGVAQADTGALGELLLRVNRELGTGLVIVEHDLPLLSRLADRMVAMVSGRVIADGAPAEVRSHPEVIRSYLGPELPTSEKEMSYVESA